jgi:hypothetical protein
VQTFIATRVCPLSRLERWSYSERVVSYPAC